MTEIFDATMDDTDLERQFEVAFILDELSPADRATIAMNAGNVVRADLRALPQYVDGLRPEWIIYRRNRPPSAGERLTGMLRAHP